MARTITLKNPERFKDPANLTWERYVAQQARERERYLAERATIPAEAMAYKSVSPRYLERAVDQFANNYYSELSATHYIATAAANALPSPSCATAREPACCNTLPDASQSSPRRC